jgi:ABC-type transport system substrate-binding protein
MDRGYWNQVLRQRTSRRRAIAASGAAGLGGLLLAACGGSDGGGDGGAETGGLLSKPVDTTKQAKVGGIFKGEISAEPQTMDPYFTSLSGATRGSRMQARLFQFIPGITKPSSGEIEGDLFKSYEVSTDGLTITGKMNMNAHWDPRAPTNGRVVDSSDVVFSAARHKSVGSQRIDYWNELSSAAPIASMTAIDKETVQIKLAEPAAGIIAQLTSTGSGHFQVMPKESDGGYDVRIESRSAGPYLLWDHKTGIGSTYKRNPGHHFPYPYMETLELPIVIEYAAALAQFKAGAIYQLTASNVTADDILPTKRDVPDLTLIPTEIGANTVRILFGFQDGNDSPFRDIRLRQAFSYATDRDLFIDAVYNVSGFEKEGLTMNTAWNTALAATNEGWWLDPKSKDFGDTAKYLQHNIAEAKKLVQAASGSPSMDINAYYVTTSEYGRDFPKHVEIILGMIREAGLNAKTNPVGFTTDWRPKFADIHGDHPGVAFRIDNGRPDPGDNLFSHYNSKAALFQGFTPDGKSTFAGDPKMDDWTTKMRREFDTKKRIALAQELQKYEAQMQYWPLAPGGANSFRLAWPCIQNFGVYTGGRDQLVYEWIDETKPPFKKT